MTDQPGEGYVYRYSALLKSLLGARGGEPVHELAPELVAALILENDPPEYKLLRSEYLSAGGLAFGASAANTNALALFLPANVNVIGIVEELTVSAGIAVQYSVRVHSGNPASAGAQQPNDNPRDLRLIGNTGRTPFQIWTLQQVAQLVGFELFEHRVVAGDGKTHGSDRVPLAILVPGTAISCQSITVNAGMEISFKWRWRPLEPGENKTQ